MSCHESDCKLLPMECAVQLIVFVAAIREILKKKIYYVDKECFCLMKIKSYSGSSSTTGGETRIRRIGFANRVSRSEADTRVRSSAHPSKTAKGGAAHSSPLGGARCVCKLIQLTTDKS